MLSAQNLRRGAGQDEDSQTSGVTDDAADEMSILRGARIRSFVSFTSVCSFYDAAGRIEGAQHPKWPGRAYLCFVHMSGKHA